MAQNSRVTQHIKSKSCNWKSARDPTEAEIAQQEQIFLDPRKSANDCRKYVEVWLKGYHEQLYRVLAYAYAIAFYLRKDPPDYEIFMSNRFFTKQKIPNNQIEDKKVLSHVLEFVFIARSKQLRSRTGKYTHALLPYLEQDMPPHLIAENISQAGGIDALYETVKEAKGRAIAKTLSEETVKTDDDGQEEKNSHVPDKSESEVIEFGLVPPQRSINVFMKSRFRKQIFEMKHNQHATLQVRCRLKDGEELRIVAVALKSEMVTEG